MGCPGRPPRSRRHRGCRNRLPLHRRRDDRRSARDRQSLDRRLRGGRGRFRQRGGGRIPSPGRERGPSCHSPGRPGHVDGHRPSPRRAARTTPSRRASGSRRGDAGWSAHCARGHLSHQERFNRTEVSSSYLELKPKIYEREVIEANGPCSPITKHPLSAPDTEHWRGSAGRDVRAPARQAADGSRHASARRPRGKRTWPAEVTTPSSRRG